MCDEMGFIGGVTKAFSCGRRRTAFGVPRNEHCAVFGGSRWWWMRSFLKVCNYSSVCSPIFNLRTLCTLLASTFSRKRRLCFEQILTPIYKNWFTFRTDAHGAPLRVRANKVRRGGIYRCVKIVRTKASLREGGVTEGDGGSLRNYRKYLAISQVITIKSRTLLHPTRSGAPSRREPIFAFQTPQQIKI